MIDEKLQERDHKVPYFICIPIMVLNDPGFIEQRLYLFPDYFRTIYSGLFIQDYLFRTIYSGLFIQDYLFRTIYSGLFISGLFL
ncbi:Mobile element protein [Methanosarcina vacuolata Z-761]|uniref:Mobile element protein n=1 Tax=Methanosarcina vacuolata Z-761 TaxID=1434123 RepID=A0A0E3Q5D0_9EURY|nr:Mobile element protein [Methanosarcina vacuolata Z-761]